MSKSGLKLPRFLVVSTASALFATLVASGPFSSAFASPVGADETSAISRSELAARLDAISKQALADAATAGFSVAVLRGSETVLVSSYGLADVGLDVKATNETKYRLVGPPVTMLSVLLMQLVEEGRLSLDQSVSDLLPDFPWQGHSVTLRQLLETSSGLPDYHYLGDEFMAEAAVPKSRRDVTDLFAGRPFMHDPGVRQQWTVSGFHLAGVLLERLTGERFGTLIEERVAKPLGLQNIVSCPAGKIVEDLATGYREAGNGLVRGRPDSPTLFPFAVQICSTALDVARFYHQLESTRLLDPVSRSELFALSPIAEKRLEGEEDARVLAGFFLDLEDDRIFFEIGGLELGYGSHAVRVPEQDLTVVVLTNTYWHPNPRFVFNLTRAAMGKAPAFPKKSMPRGDELQDLKVTEQELATIEGVYVTNLTDPDPEDRYYERTYRVYTAAGGAMIQAIGEIPERLMKQSDGSFARASEPEVRIQFEDGEANTVVLTFIEDGKLVERGLKRQSAGTAQGMPFGRNS